MLFYFLFSRERLSQNGNVSQNVFLVLILEGVLFIWPTPSSFRCEGSLCEICLNKVFFLIFLLIMSFWESMIIVICRVSHISINHSQMTRKEPDNVSQP